LNCRYPAAVNARTLTGDTICNVVFMALAGVLPQRVIAESGTTPPLRIFVSGTGLDEVPFTFHLFANGGMGARPTADGLHCTPYPTNIQCASMEVMESVAPLLVWKKELAPDSGGPGRYMGGLGQDMTVEVISDKPVTLSVISEKWDFPPLGRAGGMAARANRAEKVMGEGPLPRKGRTQLLPGDVINLSFAGGGGYGPPAERDPARVVEDLRDGLISEERARNVFGVDVNTSVDDRR
jgi:N-methylhydantoinase B